MTANSAILNGTANSEIVNIYKHKKEVQNENLDNEETGVL